VKDATCPISTRGARGGTRQTVCCREEEALAREERGSAAEGVRASAGRGWRVRRGREEDCCAEARGGGAECGEALPEAAARRGAQCRRRGEETDGAPESEFCDEVAWRVLRDEHDDAERPAERCGVALAPARLVVDASVCSSLRTQKLTRCLAGAILCRVKRALPAARAGREPLQQNPHRVEQFGMNLRRPQPNKRKTTAAITVHCLCSICFALLARRESPAGKLTAFRAAKVTPIAQPARVLCPESRVQHVVQFTYVRTCCRQQRHNA
jgi:hypothetical protein